MDDPPPSEEHYSLRWNNHQSHLMRSIEALLHAETLVDVTLVCAERRVRAHKVLLGACSPLFRRIFSENPCKHPVIVLKDFQGWEVQAVVDFMYRGEVSVAQEQLGTVIRAGESLQVRGLAERERDDLDLEPVESDEVPESPRGRASPDPQPRRKQARPRRRSGDAPPDPPPMPCTPPPVEPERAENLSVRRSPGASSAASTGNGLKAVRLARPRSPEPPAPSPEPLPPPPRLFPPHQDMFPPALTLTPPHKLTWNRTHDPRLSSPQYDHDSRTGNHYDPLQRPWSRDNGLSMFGLESQLGLFPGGMEPGKMYNPLMDLDPRAPPLDAPIFTNVKKKWRPKGQHSAPRGGPPRSWTNAELTEALQHVWNKKMTTSQASRIFGIPYNSLLMYVRGKYGKSLKLEQLRKDCIGGPLDMLNLTSGNNNNNHPPGKHHDKEDPHNSSNQRPASSEPDLMSNPMFNPFSQSFYPEFPPGFPMPLNMLHLLPPADKGRDLYQSMPLALDSLSAGKDDDCKSDRSKENSADEEPDIYRPSIPLSREERRELMQQNGQD